MMVMSVNAFRDIIGLMGHVMSVRMDRRIMEHRGGAMRCVWRIRGGMGAVVNVWMGIIGRMGYVIPVR